jgi:hypothetical protein
MNEVIQVRIVVDYFLILRWSQKELRAAEKTNALYCRCIMTSGLRRIVIRSNSLVHIIW